MKTLFHVPIATGGQFECTSPADRVYLLSFESPPDNRLTPAFNEAFVVALDLVEHKLPKGVLVTTSKIDKFYSNGLDLSLLTTPGTRTQFMAKSFMPLLHRLLTFGMPTVALINGHAFAGGMIVALHHDYRVQNPKKGYLCMNEVLFGANMAPPLLGIFRMKITAPATFRSFILEGHRFTAEQALEEGITDAHGGLDEVLQLIKTRDLVKKGDMNVYGSLREEMYREQVQLLEASVASAAYHAAADAKRVIAWEEQEDRLKLWESKIVSKL